MSGMASGALSGIKVLDFSTLLPGPMATLFLADAGAQVLKIERPETGDDMRAYAPAWGQDGVNFHMLNRGKDSLALNLRDPECRAVLDPLIAEADILIEQFRPGVMQRLGLDYEAVRAINPKIIYCSISGYGQDGPARDEAGHDLNYIARTGLLALSPGTQQAPVVPPALIADIAGGTYPALLNILLALRQRDQTGQGAYIDISMAENLFPFLYWALGEGQVTGQYPGNADSLVTGGSPRYRLYPARDGRFVAVAALEPKFWDAFCTAIDLPDALRDDQADPAATIAGVARRLAARDSTDWKDVLHQADCCCTIVHILSEALEDPQFKARGIFQRTQANLQGERIAALPTPVAPAFRSAPGSARAPQLGEADAQDGPTPLAGKGPRP